MEINLFKLSKNLSCFNVRIVFTAHPTQFYSASVLDIISNLRSLIDENNIDEIDIALQQLGLTSLINTKKPTPFDEAKNIIYFLRNVYYDAVGELYSYIRKNIQDSHFDCPDIIQIGFWPGGDRDGNPFVTWETTRDVADELRMTLMKCYYQELKNLEKKLTFREVEDIVENIMAKLYVTMFDPTKTIRYEEIVDPLHLIKSSLIDKYNSLYLEELENLIDKVNIFRTHFATLDIRQNHSVHKQVIQEILKREKLIDSSLEELGNDELLAILLRKDIS
ncbi:MAG: phosphoenolpyruvate carboxylase, partial [Desulfobacteraceae bacterium]